MCIVFSPWQLPPPPVAIKARQKMRVKRYQNGKPMNTAEEKLSQLAQQ
ncbi:hypothetical protein [Pseudoduganella lutea]|nr:hypothetical protein [Pseudoduganella lutea]